MPHQMKSLAECVEPLDALPGKECALQRIRATNWQVAIGLQDVDGLRPSDYLLEIAKQNVKCEHSLKECHRLINSHYSSAIDHALREKEADVASINIVDILTANSLSFSADAFIMVHRKIFDGVFKDAGVLRTFDITKREWVLEGDTVRYLNWEDLYRALEWEINREKNFSYRGLNENEKIEHIANFLSNLWQIHPFSEGNTRTTAVFAIQYLRNLGFQIDVRVFALHARYFRDALVRANYRNVPKGIEYEFEHLKHFLKNLLLGEKWELKSSDLHIKKKSGARHK